ncbi:MAG TPA: hypothetical protein P5559_02455 [Candidatus Limiplasma sp.]|nr:hypothetical protein [Candidatus Limiplasma sp.]
MKRVLTLLMAVTLLIGAFAGTAFAATQKIVFCVNIQPQLPVEYWQSIADAYMAANPDVEVEIIGQPPPTWTFSSMKKPCWPPDSSPMSWLCRTQPTLCPPARCCPSRTKS